MPDRFVGLKMTIGALGMIALLSLPGCVGRKYVNRTLYGPWEEPMVRSDAPNIEVADNVAFDDPQLDYTPGGVNAAFRESHRNATVTSVDPVPVGNGRLAYKVTYVDEGGRFGSEIYTPGGRSYTSQAAGEGYTDWRAEAYGLKVTRPNPAAATRPAVIIE